MTTSELQLYRFNAASFLDTPEVRQHYLDAVIADGDVEEIKDAINDIAAAIGLDVIAKSAGVDREDLSLALSATFKEPRHAEVIAQVVQRYRLAIGDQFG